MTLFATDPTDNNEEVKELTAEERYYQYLAVNEVYSPVYEYITEMERSLKAKNQALEVILNEMRSTDKLTTYINRLEKIQKL